jgi:hypothetical protein
MPLFGTVLPRVITHRGRKGRFWRLHGQGYVGAVSRLVVEAVATRTRTNQIPYQCATDRRSWPYSPDWPLAPLARVLGRVAPTFAT